MDPPKLLSCLKSLASEFNSDPVLFRALSTRFLADAEEYFPPQLEQLLASFAKLSYADEALATGFAGRCEDLTVDASPKRVVNVLQCCATLRLPTEAWLQSLLIQLHRHAPHIHAGAPSALESLRSLGVRDDSVELLLAQGLEASEKLGDGYLTRVLERWSRFGADDAEAVECAEQLAVIAPKLDIRDGLNLLACLLRCGRARAASELSVKLAARLQKGRPTEVHGATLWMRQLVLSTPALWEVCADAVEMRLRDKRFRRFGLAEAVHSLACVAPKGSALLGKVLASKEVLASLHSYTGPKSLMLLHAACLTARDAEELPQIPWEELSTQVARTCRQLTLQERRTLHSVADALRHLDSRHELGLSPLIDRMQQLPCPPLPARVPAHNQESWDGVRVGHQMVLQSPTKEGTKDGVLFLDACDFLTLPGASDPPTHIAPARQLDLDALKRAGWKVDLRI